MANYEIRRGMPIFDVNGQSIGTVEDFNDQYFTAGGQQYSLSANDAYRFENDGIYLTGTQNYVDTAQNAAELRVPVIEEQLNVGKQQVQQGEVQIHKTVTQEQVSVPVELRREEVHVQQVDVSNRPLQPGELETAFQEGTIRVPVRGEEAVVAKQAVVTGEVDINKTVTAEQQTISDTVRREEVHVDDSTLRETRAGGVRTTENYKES